MMFTDYYWFAVHVRDDGRVVVDADNPQLRRVDALIHGALYPHGDVLVTVYAASAAEILPDLDTAKWAERR